MGETSDDIKRNIGRTREALGENVQELERKVKDATDWKAQYQKRPFTMIGVAFGGGLLLSQMVAGGGRNGRKRYYETNGHAQESRGARLQPASPATDAQMKRAADTWDKIKGALVGVAATKFREFVGEVIPGFREEYRKVEQKRISGPVLESSNSTDRAV